jgi:hypothetical protein
MRSIQHTSGTLAVLATSALIGLGGAGTANALAADAPRTAFGTTTTTHERGHVIECTGIIGDRSVYASVYENSTYANVIQVLIGDDENQVGNSREVAEGFLEHEQVHGSLRVGPKRAVVSGAAERVGKRIPVHEQYDDAGQLITVDGIHRRLRTDLTLSWGRRTVPLDCDNAFFYRLQVTKEDITG